MTMSAPHGGGWLGVEGFVALEFDWKREMLALRVAFDHNKIM